MLPSQSNPLDIKSYSADRSGVDRQQTEHLETEHLQLLICKET
ncbi:hypothetical protein [Microcoleus sp. F4-D5]